MTGRGLTVFRKKSFNVIVSLKINIAHKQNASLEYQTKIFD